MSISKFESFTLKQDPSLPEDSNVCPGPVTISNEARLRLERINAYWASKEVECTQALRSGVPLVAEGDSWFDYRIAPDVIDWLERDFGYEITNVAKAGATTYEMAYGPDNDQPIADFFGRDPSQLAEVVRLVMTKRPRAVLLSGAGNDFSGPEFILIIRHALAKSSGVNRKVFEAILSHDIEPAYQLMIETITAAGREAGLDDVPILIHGYDYPYPDGRKVNLLFGLISIGPWLHDAFEKKGYPYRNEVDLKRRHEEVRILIDMLYEMLGRLSARYPNVHVVDVRNTLSNHSQWHNELHPNGAGFRLVARRFRDVLLSLQLQGDLPDPAQFSLNFKEDPPIDPLDRHKEALTLALEKIHGSPEETIQDEVEDFSEVSEPVAAFADWERVRDELTAEFQSIPQSLIGACLHRWEGFGELLRESLTFERAYPRRSSVRDEGVTALARPKAPTLEEREDEYLCLFDSCEVRKDKRGDVAWYLNRIGRGRKRYEALERELGVPWYFIGILHSLEASNDFTRHLHNGDSLARRTVRVPRNRPHGDAPFTWEASARDALMLKKFHLQTDWSLPAILYSFERYNGWGYAWRGLRSPYLWSFSQHHVRGKYVRDGVYDPDAISKQVGAGVLLKKLKS